MDKEVEEKIIREMCGLVHNFQPTRYELEVLIKHYLEIARALDRDLVYPDEDTWKSISRANFSYHRLGTIEDAVGTGAFRQALAEADQRVKVDEYAEEQENTLTPCVKCGRKRTLGDDYLWGDGTCGICAQRIARERTKSTSEHNGE